MSNLITELINKNEPFAIVQYFEWVKGSKSESNKVYELLRIKDSRYRNEKYISYKKLSYTEIKNFKKNINKLNIKHNNTDGKVFEYRSFKDIVEKENVKKEYA